MPITTNFQMFANKYHQNCGRLDKVIEPDLMAQLPNDLIMIIIQMVDGGLNTHKQKFSKCMTEFQALDGLEWMEKGACIGEAFRLEDYAPEGVYMGNQGLEIDMHDVDTDEGLLFAERWIHRLGVGRYPADLDAFGELS